MKSFQERMFRLVTRRDAKPGDPELADWVAANDDDEAADRLGVYAGMFGQRMLEAMEQDFPRTLDRLGREQFAETVERYVAAHPSTDASIRNLGARFADFLGAGADEARIDWACVEAVDSADGSPLRRETLEGLPMDAWPELRLRLVPSARMVTVFQRIVWRRGFDVCERALDRDEAMALRRLLAGCTFAEACEAFAASPDRIRTALEQWIVDELLTLDA